MAFTDCSIVKSLSRDSRFSRWPVELKNLGSISILGWLLLLCCVPQLVASESVPQFAQALHRTLAKTGAVAIVMDVHSGRVLASERANEAAALLSTPGSVLKPFFLATALQAGRIQPETTVYCRRMLRISGRQLPCTHPQRGLALSAEEALAYSCNNYFAQLANRLTSEETFETLQSYGLTLQPHLFPAEALPVMTKPVTPEEKQLLVLGVQGIRITAAQLAVAYRKLALNIANRQNNPALHTVAQGLDDSVRYGMAHNAAVEDLQIWGKTGTANDTPYSRSHGWFAGIVPMQSSGFVIVIYLPHGNGGDAAHLAQQFLLAYRNSSHR